jgi:TPP-dependent pyruvate/acetoin dehydrogenase alpha subunit
MNLIEAYRLMLVSRAIDDACARVLADGDAVPNYHSGRGQEALVALGMVLDTPDYLQFNYRDFPALLAKGLSLDALVADLRLKATGTTAGYGGIMHVSAPELGIVGRNSIFGSRFGIAVGLALSAQLEGAGRVVMCTYGEAEGGRGPIYEAINFACLRSLPIIFVAQNNGFCISARTAALYAGGDMSSQWRGMPMPVTAVDGNDVAAVHTVAQAAVERARAGLGPSLVETVTYRIDAHFPTEADFLGRFDYRDEAEIDGWRAKDPIDRTERQLLAAGKLDASAIATLRGEVGDEVERSFAAAAASPDPDPAAVLQFRYHSEVPQHV